MSKIRIATTSLAGCFGCHMSFLDMDERLVGLLEYVEFDRSPSPTSSIASPVTLVWWKAACVMPKTCMYCANSASNAKS